MDDDACPHPTLPAVADWLTLAMAHAPVAVGVSRLRDGVFVAANPAFCRLFGWSLAEVLGRTAHALQLWPEPARRDELIAQLRRHGTVRGWPARYRHRLGETGALEVSACVLAHAGEPLLLGFLTEVSDRHELLEGLRAAHGRLGVALRASGLLVFAQDRSLRYTWVANPALGVTEAQVLGRSDEDLLGARTAAPLVAIKRRVLDSGRAERGDVWVANNGQLACFDLVVEPERDAAGRVCGIVCAAQDITAHMTALPQPQRAWPGPPAGAATDAAGPVDPAAAGPGGTGAAAPVAPAATAATAATASSAGSASSSLHAIAGLSALLRRELFTPRQAQRLRRIGLEAGRLARPRSAEAEAEAPLQRLRRRHAGTPVLLAEAHPVQRELVLALLQAAGLQVRVATSGVEAYRQALQAPPALLLLDMEMPQRGAVAAARALRATLAQALPIIAMASPHAPQDMAAMLDAELDDLLDKPVAAEPLYAQLLSWLECP